MDGEQTVNPIPMTIVNRFAPVLAVRPAFCVGDRSAHFFSPPRDNVICCRCGSACFGWCDEIGRERTWRRAAAARRRARRAGVVVSGVDMRCGAGGLLDAAMWGVWSGARGGGAEGGGEMCGVWRGSDACYHSRVDVIAAVSRHLDTTPA